MRYPFFTADTGQDAGNNVPDMNEPAKPKLETPSDSEKKFTQAEFESKLDEKIREREARIKKQYEAQQREAQQAMEAKQLEEQAEWQKLANRRADEIKDLKPRAALSEAYEKGVQRVMDIATRNIDSNEQFLLSKVSLPDQLDWLERHLENINKPPPAINGRTNTNAWDRNSGGAPAQLSDEEFRAKRRRELGSV